MHNTGLFYKGDVKITLNKKTYIKHNNGTPALFRLLTQFLSFNTGPTPRPTASPSHIMLKYMNPYASGEPAYTDALTSKLGVYSNQIDVNGSPKAVFFCTIDYSNILDGVINDKYNYRLSLLSNDADSTQLAYIDIDTDIILQLEAGHQAQIEWYLGFHNGTEGDN